MIMPEHRQLVDRATNGVLAAMSPERIAAEGEIIGHLASAQFLVHGEDVAIQFAQKQAEYREMPSDVSFLTWAALLKTGAQRALMPARRTAGITSHDATLLGSVETRELRSAERLVHLVEAGDKETLLLARGKVNAMGTIVERPRLLAKLYQTGDHNSFEFALASAKDAWRYCDGTADGSATTLLDIGIYAASHYGVNNAIKITEYVGEGIVSDTIHAELYRNGHRNFTHEVDKIINDPESQDLIPRLALGGHPVAIDMLRKQYLPFFRQRLSPLDDIQPHLAALEALHAQGYRKAAPRMLELIRHSADAPEYLPYLGRVGLKHEQLQLASKLFRMDPTFTSAFQVCIADFTPARWQTAFKLAMESRQMPQDALTLSAQVEYLAASISTQAA